MQHSRCPYSQHNRVSLTRTFALVALAFLIPFGAPSHAKKKVDLSDWVRGPVRYIISEPEIKTFKALKSDNDRALFIERFWHRRNPDPNYLTNRYRKMFWDRVVETNRLFLDSSRPGWMTDRGKIYILYGPPTRIEDELHLEVDEGIGLIRWTYEGRPEGRMDMDPTVIVPFVRDASGEYRVSYDPKLSSVFFNAQLVRSGWNEQAERWLERMAPPDTSRLSVMLDLGRMQEVPPGSLVLMERVETLESYETDALTAQLQRFKHPDQPVDGLISITIDLAELQVDQPGSVLARFIRKDNPSDIRMLDEYSFRYVDSEQGRIAQARVKLEPADYIVTLMVIDPTRGRTGMYRSEFRVPEPTERMRLSDITLAESLEPVRYRSVASHDEPFIVGPFRVIPRFENVYEPGDVVRLMYEVYDARMPVTVSYQLEGQEDDGSWRALGSPSVAPQEGQAQAWELPTSPNWPLGAYRIRVELTDADGKLVSKQVDFSLAQPTLAAQNP